MNRSLAALTRRNREAHLQQQLAGADRGGEFHCMEDGSLVSYDAVTLASRRSAAASGASAAGARSETPTPTPLPTPGAARAVHPSKSPSSLLASLARKVSARITFREAERQSLVAAALAAAAAATPAAADPDDAEDGRNDRNEDPSDHQLSQLLNQRRPRPAGALAPPSVMPEDGSLHPLRRPSRGAHASPAPTLRRHHRSPSAAAAAKLRARTGPGHRDSSGSRSPAARRSPAEADDPAAPPTDAPRRSDSGGSGSSHGRSGSAGRSGSRPRPRPPSDRSLLRSERQASPSGRQWKASSHSPQRTHGSDHVAASSRLRKSSSHSPVRAPAVDAEPAARWRRAVRNGPPDPEVAEPVGSDLKRKVRRRVLVKVRNVTENGGGDEADVSAGLGTDQGTAPFTNEDLVRQALETVRSGRISHQYLQSKLSSASGRPRRKERSDMQATMEPSREPRRSKSPATKSPTMCVKVSVDNKLSPSKSPASSSSSTAHSMKLTKSPMDMPERTPSSEKRWAGMDIPVGVLPRPPIQSEQRRPSRSKSRNDNDMVQRSRHSTKRLGDDAARKSDPSPTVVQIRKDSSRSPSSSRKKSESPRELRKRSPELEDLHKYVLDVSGETFRSKTGSHGTVRSKSEHVPKAAGSGTEVPSSDCKSSHSPKTRTSRIDLSPRKSSSPSRSSSTPVVASQKHHIKDHGAVQELRRHASEGSNTNSTKVAKSKLAEALSSGATRCPPRRRMALDTSGWKNSSDDSVASESLRTENETHVSSRKKKVLMKKSSPKTNHGNCKKIGNDDRAESSRRDRRDCATATADVSLGNINAGTSTSHQFSLPKSRRTIESLSYSESSGNQSAAARQRQTIEASDESDSEEHLLFGSRTNFKTDDSDDDDEIIKLKPSSHKPRPILAAQLQLPGLSPKILSGDEVSVHYEDVTPYNDDPNAF